MARPYGKKNKAIGALAASALLALLAACAPTVQAPPPVRQAAPPRVEPPIEAPTPPPTVSGSPLEAPGRGDRVEVAFLVPLTGPNAAVGKALLDAAQMAVFDTAGSQFELIPRDTGGTAEGARAALADALAEGAGLVLGPLTGAETAAVRAQAQGSGVPVVSFSTDWTTLGDGIYSLGFLPFEQVRRVTSFAARQGYRQFGAFLPTNLYGAVVASSFDNAVVQSGAVLAELERYDPQAGDLAQRALALASGPRLDALMIAEGGAQASQVVEQLRAAGVDTTRVKLLGTGLWDDLTLGQKEPSLVGGWFAAPTPQARTDFERRFQALYGYNPPRLATLGYDAVALAATLAQMPGGPRFDAATLTQPSGFSGVDGIFRFTPDGRNQRGLAVLEVRPNGLAVLDPAPTDFRPLGF